MKFKFIKFYPKADPAIFFLGILFTLFLVLSYSFPPVYDDAAILNENKFVKSQDFASIWTNTYWEGIGGNKGKAEALYRPLFLSLTSLLQEFPALLRALVLLTHFLLTYFLYHFLKNKINNPELAFIGALFFALHPGNVEVTAQIIGLLETLPLLLGLFSISIASSNPIASVILAGLSPGIKETGFLIVFFVSLVFLLKKRLKFFLILSSIGTAWFILRTQVLGDAFLFKQQPYSLLNPLVKMDFWDQILSQISLLGHHLRILFFPIFLTSDYSRGSLPLPASLTQIWFLLGIIFIFIFFRLRKKLSFESVLPASTLLPSLHLMGPIGIIFAERFGYGLRFSLILLLSLWISHRYEKLHSIKKRTINALLIIVIFGFGCLSFLRLTEWRSLEVLSKSDLATYPKNAKLWFNLGMSYGSQSRWDEAAQAFRSSLNLAPDFPEAHFRMGLVLRELKEDEESQRHFREADRLGYSMTE